MKRIDVRNSKLLGDDKNNYKLSRKLNIGIITAALLVGIPTMMFMNNKKNKNIDNTITNDIFTEARTEDPINVDIQDINSMNIIINDADCSDTFMDEVYSILEKDGINFTKCKNLNKGDIEDAVIFTLDQQYINGPGMMVIAPYNNDISGNSDALALACDAAFYENGFFVSEIECGIRGYREEKDGYVSERIPTETEEKVKKYPNSSFVTLSFGTGNSNSQLVASSIENALVRYYSYINNNDINEDLIYRSTKDDNYEDIANRFSTNVDSLKMINDKNDNMVLENSSFKNPCVSSIKEFNHLVPINLYVEKTRWSK